MFQFLCQIACEGIQQQEENYAVQVQISWAFNVFSIVGLKAGIPSYFNMWYLRNKTMKKRKKRQAKTRLLNTDDKLVVARREVVVGKVK